MADTEALAGRVLSHRLRGFDRRESTRRGLELGLKAGIRHAEFDVRVTRDGHPIAYHDPFFRADDGTWQYIDEWDLAALRGQQSLSPLATLEDMCACFGEFGRPDSFLHVDVKVGGQEALIRDTIDRFGLLAHIVLVSWLPDVLVRFHAVSPDTRLCFSHLPVAGGWYGFAKAIGPLLEGMEPILSFVLRPIAPHLSNETLTVRLHFHDNGDPAGGGEDDEAPRCNHGHVVPGMLTGVMLDLLRRTDGLVCVPVPLATRTLVSRYRSQGIQTAVYSVASVRAFDGVIERLDPDIVYVDDGAAIRRILQPNALRA